MPTVKFAVFVSYSKVSDVPDVNF